MESNLTREQLRLVANQIGIDDFPSQWAGIDTVLPILEKMKGEGAVIVIKLDGQRTPSDDNGSYTLIVSGGLLEEEFLRVDTDGLEDGLSNVIVGYAKRCWNFAT